jgi:hypothetical protein
MQQNRLVLALAGLFLSLAGAQEADTTAAVDVAAAGEPSSRPREAKQLLNEPEQKYDFELSFPVDSDEATNVKDGRRARIEALLQSILLENEALVSFRTPSAHTYISCTEANS